MTQILQGRRGWLALLAVALAFPWLVPNSYYVSVGALAFVMVISVLGLNLLTGYTGQLNLAHGAFMAIGAYTVGILTTSYNVHYWIAFVLAGVVTALSGLAVGLLSLRLRGNYFAVFTLCVGYIVYLVIEKWESLTQGTVGIMGIPAPPAPGGFVFESPLAQYYLALAFLVLGLCLMARITGSLVGRSFMAVRNSEALAQAIGISLWRTKVLSFVLSVVYAGFAGALYAGQVRFLGPDIAGEVMTFDLVMFALVGGLGTLLGPVVGTFLVTVFTQSLQFLQDYRMLVFGPALIALLIFLPDGIVGAWQKRRARRATLVSDAKAPTATAMARVVIPAEDQSNA
ncbi:branched-chain amino acid ABC transporter permease [Cupriavidus necator]|uniref:Branched-chain amino acid ABC transporter permease n=1 Tax=Cupriavidus necator TaxID=106590 RepID=A0A367PG23_CUPNE|nr:branched-chain amino acid ABC transporter permease [Cupriavidus necator]QQX86650.1 branched-chain amino acid ABC transporter permease [Cupriavidus necator]RCJ06841.1 branched-chain amino acid ABC transporter permease [Cupriavidus necator]